MQRHARPYGMLWMRMRLGLVALSLMLSLMGCATPQVSAVQPVQCVHPDIDPTLQGGLSLAVQAYAEALNLCNTLNGYPLEEP